MQAYLIRRLLLLIPTLLILTIVVFLMVRLVPGDIVDIMVRNMSRSSSGEIDRAEVERRLGLDVAVPVQYGRWLGVLPRPDPVTGEFHYQGILQGNLGFNYYTLRPVMPQIVARLATTVELGLMAYVIALLIALPVGIYSALRQDTVVDYVGRTFAIIGLSLPNFWLATMVMLFPAIWWGWSPAVRLIPFTEDPLGNLRQFIIPGVILGTSGSALTMRMTRTMMLEVLRQDYIRTAWSKGLKERSVVLRHAMKNAMIPVVTIAGGILPALIGGAVIMEQIFALPGIGRLGLSALTGRNYPMVSALNLIMATVVMVNILLIDMSYAYLDPRVRYK